MSTPLTFLIAISRFCHHPILPSAGIFGHKNQQGAAHIDDYLKKTAMTIHDDKTLAEIQKEFNDKFPYLQLKFYAAGHRVGEHSPSHLTLEGTKSIGQVRAVHAEGEMSINANQKISTLEQHFADMYGLNVQVFRKSANLWLQTTKTDEWTLAEANRKGEHSVDAYREKYEE